MLRGDRADDGGEACQHFADDERSQCAAPVVSNGWISHGVEARAHPRAGEVTHTTSVWHPPGRPARCARELWGVGHLIEAERLYAGSFYGVGQPHFVAVLTRS